MPVVIRKEDQRDGSIGYVPPSSIPVKVRLIGDKHNAYVIYKMTSPSYTRVAMELGNSTVKFRADCRDYRNRIQVISLIINGHNTTGELGNIKYIEIYEDKDGGALLREYEVINMSPLKFKRRYRYGKMTGNGKINSCCTDLSEKEINKKKVVENKWLIK